MTFKLIQQECIEWMADQPEKSINCVITSPPYNLDIRYGQYQDDQPRDSYLKWLGDIAIATKRVLKDDGHLFLNVGYSNIDPWVAMDVAQVFRKEFVLQNNFTWVKHIMVNDTGHGQYKPITSNRFASATTESIFHFTKDGNASVDRLAIGQRNTTHSLYPELYSENRYVATERRKLVRKHGHKDWKSFKKTATNEEYESFNIELTEHLLQNPYDPNKKKCIGNAWYIPYMPTSKLARLAGSVSDSSRELARGNHPATFPEQLPDMCIKFSGIPKGSTVYDPFAGTGTTVVAADKNGMHGIGTDIDDNYLEFAKKRFVDTVVELI